MRQRDTRTARASARRVIASAALLLTAATTAVVGTTEPATATTGYDYARQAFRTTNNVRARHDEPALHRSRCLKRFAARQATRMANQERMFHQSLTVVLDSCGLSLVGENVAYGYPTGRAVVLDGWMKSAGHRANILDGRFRKMAIAARRGDNGRWYVSQVFGRRLA